MGSGLSPWEGSSSMVRGTGSIRGIWAWFPPLALNILSATFGLESDSWIYKEYINTRGTEP